MLNPENMFSDQAEKISKLYESYKKLQLENEKMSQEEISLEKYRAWCQMKASPPDCDVVFNRLYSFLNLPWIKSEVDKLIDIIDDLDKKKEIGKVLGVLKLEGYPILNLAIRLDFF